jgi:YHS domain-containing protein
MVVYEGKVIAFCCPNCPKQFWTDPQKFLAALTGR